MLLAIKLVFRHQNMQYLCQINEYSCHPLKYVSLGSESTDITITIDGTAAVFYLLNQKFSGNNISKREIFCAHIYTSLTGKGLMAHATSWSTVYEALYNNHKIYYQLRHIGHRLVHTWINVKDKLILNNFERG